MIGVYEIRVPVYTFEREKTRMVVAYCNDVQGTWAYIDADVPDHITFILVCENYIKDYVMRYIEKRLPKAKMVTLKQEKEEKE